LRTKPLSCGVLRDNWRSRQPAGAHWKHKTRSREGCTSIWSRPRFFRNEWHFDVEQDGRTGTAGPWRHHVGRPQLSQVPPLWSGDRRRASPLRRSLSAYAVLHVWGSATANHQESSTRPKG